MRRLVLVATMLAIVGPASVSNAADAPAWMIDAAKLPASPIEKGADAVVLHDDTNITVLPDGRTVTRRSYVVRVLNKNGASAASLREVYETKSSEIRTLRAWVLSDGRVVQLGKPDIVDMALVDNDVYNEARTRVITARSLATPGVVFGGESEKIDGSVFAQFEWWLQDRWPVRRVRRTLTLPNGWNAQSVTLNSAPIAPSVEGNTRVWTASDLPAPPDEPNGPPESSLVPRLAVTYFGTSRGDAAAFGDWASVGSWLASLQDPEARVTPALSAKARELTTSASTDLDRIRAIGAYVQKVQYISIQTGLGRGGGYKPHAAADVLQKNYGDCKDKANLMRALLAALNIPSQLVAVYAGDVTYVKEEWPSPQQFNHAIIAIPVAAGATKLSAMLEEEGGSLLFFDPTDEQTPVGQLPRELQGSLGLVVAPSNARLRRLPLTPAAAHSRTRSIEASFATDGVFSATIRMTTLGDEASRERYLFKSVSPERYTRQLEAQMRGAFPGSVLTLGRVADERDANRFELTVGLVSNTFGQGLKNGLMVVRAAVLGTLLPSLPAGQRQTPVLLEPRDEQDRFELTIPAGAKIDELPPPSAMKMPFGRFDITWTVEGQRVTRTLVLQVDRATVEPADYAAVREFIDAFRAAESLPAVLAREN